ncbi:MAG: hypothetical protein AB1942_02660 [Pseudomonadota bacterium]
MSLADPIQVRLERELLTDIRAAARAHGRNVADEIRHRLERDGRVDLQIQGLRAEIALHGSHGPRPDDPVLDALLRLQGMLAEVLGATRRSRPVDTEHARHDVERLKLPVWGRRKDDR